MIGTIRRALERRGIFVQRHTKLYGVDWLRDLTRFRGSDSFPVVFDVGANVGQTTEYFRARLPGATIHAFEPVPDTYARLVAGVGKLGGVHCHQLALSDTVGTAEIVTTGRSVEASLSSALLSEQPGVRRETVKLTTVDAFCLANDIVAIDLLKVDTEGHELAVFDGATGLFSRRAVGAVYAEICFSADNRHNTQFSAVFDRLTGQGLRFLGLYEMEWFQELPTTTAFCNALFAMDVFRTGGESV